jgi:precorrin-3B synthase
MNVPAIKGWCPGALRPMESGDGLIVRLKLTGGIVPLDLAAQVADWSRRFGNGEIDLTARANLQLRGITTDGLPDLQQAIADAGLLDGNPDGEAIRNVVASPLAGIDPHAVLDIRPVVAALEARLAGDPKLYALPAKFCFAVDDGGRPGIGDVRADVRFEAVSGPAFAVGLDGMPEQAFGPCQPYEIPDVAARLAGVFLARHGGARRMWDLVERIGAAAIAEEASLPIFRHSREGGNPFIHKRGGPEWIPAFAGMTPRIIGVASPFGRVSARDLQYLAEQAAKAGATEFRLTPWRAILISCPSVEAAERLALTLPPDAFILDPADPRRRVAACVGAPACRGATTAIRDDAGRLAQLVGENSFLHVSGCAKGCAHPRLAPVSLVGRDGLYDLVRNGTASDSPALRGLTLDEAAAYLRQMAATQTQGPTT